MPSPKKTAKPKPKAPGVSADDVEAAQGAALLAEAMASFRSPSKEEPSKEDLPDALPPTVEEEAEAETVPALLEPWTNGVEPTGRWDDGVKLSDPPGSYVLMCSRCGSRPRPNHDFRCRLHDEDLSNGEERPTCPANMEDKMAMRRYTKDMDEWEPAWLDVDEEDSPLVEDDQAYPLPCPRCDAKTEACGPVGGKTFSTNMERIMAATDWLPRSYEGGANAPNPSMRNFDVHLAQKGRCGKCQLLLSVVPVEQ